jgi:hypothetical protein
MVKLDPFQIATLADRGTAAPKVEGADSAEYRAFIQSRIGEYEKLFADVKALNAQAAPDVYLKPAQEARKLLEAGNVYAADLTLGAGLGGELQLRKDILDRPVLKAPKVAAAPPNKGDLDAWPKEASDIRSEDGSGLAGHIFFPNSWTGPADLSARVRLAHDGEKLYVGIEVRDSVIVAKDSATISLSKSGYLDWRGQSVKADINWPLAIPPGKEAVNGKSGAFSYVARRTAAGYIFEGSVPLADLGIKPGSSIGFILRVSDSDNTPNLPPKMDWAVKQALLVPHKPNFVYWEDARNSGRLELE